MMQLSWRASNTKRRPVGCALVQLGTRLHRPINQITHSGQSPCAGQWSHLRGGGHAVAQDQLVAGCGEGVQEIAFKRAVGTKG